MNNAKRKTFRLVALLVLCCAFAVSLLGGAYANSFSLPQRLGTQLSPSFSGDDHDDDHEPKPEKCTVQFNPQNGDEAIIVKVDEGEALGTLPAAPSYPGYVFLGWFTAPTSGVMITAGHEVECDETFYAHWQKNEPETYSVTFDSQGGSSVPMQNVVDGDLAIAPAVPAKAGYNFEGWVLGSPSGAAYDFSTPVHGNITLYATWSEAEFDEYYQVTFYPQNGGTSSSIDIIQGQSVGTLPTPTRDGYTLDGWFTSATGGTQISSSTVPTEDTSYYAHWTAVEPEAYVIQHDPQNGDDATIANITPGDALGDLPAAPKRDGYTFEGWFTGQTTGTQITSATVPTSDETYYAHWTEAAPQVMEYVVDFNSQGGSSVASQQVDEGNQATKPANPTRDGYTFVAWHKGSASGPVYSFEAPVMANMTLYAEWKAITPPVVPGKVCVYFDPRGGSHVGGRTLEEGAAIGTLPKTKRSGLTFAGWYAEPGAKGAKITSSTKITKNTVVYARWLSQNNKLRAITKTSGRWSVKFSPNKKTSKILVPCKRPRTTIRFYKASKNAKLYVKIGNGSWKRINKITMKASTKMRNVYAKVVAQDGKHIRYYRVKVVDP